MIWHETRYRRVTRSGWAGKCRYARRWWEETSILEALLRPWGHLQRTPLCCPVANQRSSCVCRVYVLCCYWERKKTFSLWIICPNCLHNSERICLQRSLVTGMYWKIFSFTPRPVSFFFFVFVHTIASQVVIRFDDTFRSSNIDKVFWLWEEKASQVNLQSLPRLFVCRPVPLQCAYWIARLFLSEPAPSFIGPLLCQWHTEPLSTTQHLNCCLEETRVRKHIRSVYRNREKRKGPQGLYLGSREKEQ